MEKILVAAGFLVFTLVLVIVGLLIFHFRKGRTPTDYYLLFLFGLVWTAISIPLSNYLLMIFGLSLATVSFRHRKEWSKNRTKWGRLSKRDRATSGIIMCLAFALLAAWIATYYLLNTA